MTIKFFSENDLPSFAYFFQVQRFLLALFHSAYFPIISFSTYFITTIFYINYLMANTFNIDMGILNFYG